MRLVSALLLLVPVVASANGGPVAWNSPSGHGDLVPTKVANIHLVSERLRIELGADGDTYRVRAEYVLENTSGKPVRVNYGVPLRWVPDPFMEEQTEPDAQAKALAAKGLRDYPVSVDISLAGKRRPCTLKNVRRASPQANRVTPFEAWCVTDLDFPPGSREVLTLSYPGSLEFEDWAYSKSPFTVFSKRRLEYFLAPAAAWKGPPEFVDIDLEAGTWADDLWDLSLDGGVREGSRIKWHLVRPDMKKLSVLVVAIDGIKRREMRERVRLRIPAKKVTVTASSTLPAQGAIRYGAANVLDGNVGTAWCAAKSQDGTGGWIEVKAEQVEVGGVCFLRGFTFVPGFARDQAAYQRNNRVTAFRIGRCGELGDLNFAAPPARAAEAFVDVPAPGDLADELLQQRTLCVRLQVERVEQGADNDTCISEFRIVINCG